MAKEAENQMVCEALALMRYHVENQYNNTVSNLPRNGKGISTTMDEDNEKEVLHRIKSIDALIESYSEDRQSASTLSQDTNLPCAHQLDDHEPYVNPFTGQWVIPDCPDEPGPSCSTNGVSSVLIGGQLPIFEDKHKTFNGTTQYAKPLDVIQSAKDYNLNSSANLLRASPCDPNPEARPCDALWEAFGGDPLPPENVGYSLNAGTDNSMSLSSHNPGSSRNQPFQAENPWQASLDGQGIERSLQGIEGQTRFKGSDRPLNNDEAVPKGEGYTRLTAVPDMPRAHLPHRGPPNKYEMDRRRTTELAGDVPGDSQELLEAETSRSSEGRKQMQAAEDEISRQDQEQMEATFELIRRFQDEWNLEADLIIRQEQDVARQIAALEERKEKAKVLKEMRRMQDRMQAEDNHQLEEDMRLAHALSEIEDEVEVTPEWQTRQPPTWTKHTLYPETSSPSTWPETEAGRPLSQHQSWATNPFRWLKKTLRLAVSRSPALVPAGIFDSGPRISVSDGSHSIRSQPPRRTTPGRKVGALGRSDGIGRTRDASGKGRPPERDRDNISTKLNMARNVQNTLKEEIPKNEAAGRNALGEASRRERQARRETERLRREEGHRHRAKQPREQEQRTRLANMAECSVCAELTPKDQMCRFGCKHYYCRHCLETAIQTAITDKKAFRCCKKQVEPSVISRLLPAQVHSAYAAVVEELATPNPTYCHSRRCSIFIPPANYIGDTARCPRCSNETCRLCKQKVHPGVVCEQDAAGQALLGLGQARKWMQCPHCKTMVERSAGCLHMTCKCGTEFCYNCGKPSWRCRGAKCARR